MDKLVEPRDSVFIPKSEVKTIQHLEAILPTASPKLVGMNGEEILLPNSVYQALRQVVRLMASGRAISLIPYGHYLSTQEAADLLNVSRPYLYTLLDKGQIPYIKVGTHRRIEFEDLTIYKHKRDSQRRQSLEELAQMSQEMGFYVTDDDTQNSDASEKNS